MIAKHLGMLSDKVQVEQVGEAPKLEIVFRGKGKEEKDGDEGTDTDT